MSLFSFLPFGKPKPREVDNQSPPKPSSPPPMPPHLDPDGQPFERGYNASRRLDRDIHELLGLLKGVTAGGKLSPDGAREVARWIMRNDEIIPIWPVSIIFATYSRVLVNDTVPPAGCRELFTLFREVTGPNAAEYLNSTTSTTLPLTKPFPPVIFQDKEFVFTGKFLFGTRPACERAVCERGGSCEQYVTKRTGYLVIGTLGSADWVYSAYGRKIQQAIEAREKWQTPAIICEEHWVRAVDPRLARKA